MRSIGLLLGSLVLLAALGEVSVWLCPSEVLQGKPLFFTANRYPTAQGQALIAPEVVRHLTAAAQTYGLTP